MPQRIPLQTSVSSFRQRTSLDGVPFELEFRWNERDGAWYMSIADTDGNPLRSGIRLAVDSPLLHSLVSDTRPNGELYAIDIEDSGEEAGFDDLGQRVVLYYVTAAERAVLEA